MHLEQNFKRFALYCCPSICSWLTLTSTTCIIETGWCAYCRYHHAPAAAAVIALKLIYMIHTESEKFARTQRTIGHGACNDFNMKSHEFFFEIWLENDICLMSNHWWANIVWNIAIFFCRTLSEIIYLILSKYKRQTYFCLFYPYEYPWKIKAFKCVSFKMNEYPWMAIFANSGGLDQGDCGATLVILMFWKSHKYFGTLENPPNN